MATANNEISTEQVTLPNLISKIISGFTRMFETSHNADIVIKKKSIIARNSNHAAFDRSFTTKTQYLIRNNHF